MTMADITKCTNMTCPLRSTCYRATAQDNPEWQSFQDFEGSVVDGSYTCAWYWPVKTDEQKNTPEP